MIALFEVLGFLLTLLTLSLLLVGGYLAAWLVLGKEERSGDPLILATATLLLTTGEAVAVGLALGALGHLRIVLGLAAQTGLVLVLYRLAARRLERPQDLWSPARLALHRAWVRCREYPVLALIALHAAGTELLRGLLRPPLSWDSLMYHLFLAATWLQRGSFDIVAARHPTTFYQFMPANGSVWLWWWLAPSHSELYTGVAFLPQWLLLGLATGAFARLLGARRRWPVASFLVVLVPTVVRFVATQYVDITLGALLVAGSVFALRWARESGWRDAVLLAVAGGLAAGTKVLGLPFAGGLALAALAVSRGRWRSRLPQLAAMALIAAPLGGYFYARNLSYGGGPFGYQCAKQDEGQGESGLAVFPAKGSPLDILPELLEQRMLRGAFLGVTRPSMTELGLGPQALLLLPLTLLLPFLFTGPGRRGAWLALIQLAVQLALWLTETYAAHAHVFANVRYLIGGIGLLTAAAVALGERFLQPAWVRTIAIVLAIQDLLMLNPRMPYQVRVALAWGLVVVVVLAVAPGLRRRLAGRPGWVGGAAILAAVLVVPPWASFRLRDRERSFREDYIAHLSTTRLFAAGWGWLDHNAGAGTVAVSHAPENFFVYPAMGPYLERRAVYVNVNAANHTNPLLYPDCKTRVDPSPEAWLRNLAGEGVRWLYVARYPEFEFPVEDRWARGLPRLFHLRFADETNRIYEVGLEAGAAGAGSSPAARRRSNR